MGEKIRNMNVKHPPIVRYNFTQRWFLYLKIPLFDLCIYEFVQHFFNRMLEIWGLFKLNYLYLKVSFSVHFKEIITRFTKLDIWKILSFSLLLMVQTYFFKMVGLFIPCFTHCLSLTKIATQTLENNNYIKKKQTQKQNVQHRYIFFGINSKL